MHQNIKFPLLFAAILIGLGVLFIVQSQSSGRLKIIFCDVGQGDGMLIISPSGKQAVVDGGPGKNILNCLSENMPFWDRTIELAVSTHPQADHMEGLVAILGNYQVKTIATTGVVNNTRLFEEWQVDVAKEEAKIYTPDIGDRIILDSSGNQNTALSVLWPSRSQISDWKAKPPGDLNETGITLKLSYGDFCVYLTADVPKEILENVLEGSCQILKVAHHGSRTGTSDRLLSLVKPQLAVIQVGKNSYGHPNKDVTDLLNSYGVKILRNDVNGLVEVESDGRSFKYKIINN